MTSYKGGLGRSTTAAALSYRLASFGVRVLVIDWDFTLPGIHQFFGYKDSDLTGRKGLVDYLTDTAGLTTTQQDGPIDLADYVIHDVGIRADGGRTDILSCGSLDANYWHRMELFDWNAFYADRRGFAVVEALRAAASASYDFVVVDSGGRNSQAHSVAALQLPDVAVMLTSVNTSSLLGTANLALKLRDHEARRQWGRSKLRFLFVPTRFDGSRADVMTWLSDVGYPHVFEELQLFDTRMQPSGLATHLLEWQPELSVGDVVVTSEKFQSLAKLQATYDEMAQALIGKESVPSPL